MKLSKTSAHAALAMAFLANHSREGFVQARQVAQHLGILTESALKILQNLARQGLIQSQLGRSGGYRMVKTPKQISLLDVVEAIDGPISGQVPLSEGAVSGKLLDMLRIACEKSAKQVRQQLSQVTVAELADRDEKAMAH